MVLIRSYFDVHRIFDNAGDMTTCWFRFHSHPGGNYHLSPYMQQHLFMNESDNFEYTEPEDR